MRAIVIPEDASPIVEVDLHVDNEDGGYAALVEKIGGWLETIPYEPHISPYFDEEGKMKGLTRNVRAMDLLKGMMFPHDYIAGTCVLTGFNPRTGETVDLPENITVSEICGRLGVPA
jgi:hypothetical protein